MHSYLDAFQYQSRLYPPSKNMLSVALFALAPLIPLLSCILKLISTLACKLQLTIYRYGVSSPIRVIQHRSNANLICRLYKILSQYVIKTYMF